MYPTKFQTVFLILALLIICGITERAKSIGHIIEVGQPAESVRISFLVRRRGSEELTLHRSIGPLKISSSREISTGISIDEIQKIRDKKTRALILRVTAFSGKKELGTATWTVPPGDNDQNTSQKLWFFFPGATPPIESLTRDSQWGLASIKSPEEVSQ